MKTPIKTWLSFGLDKKDIELMDAINLECGSGCEVFDCQIKADLNLEHVFLKVYNDSFDDYSKLGIVDTVKKNLLAFNEFAEYSIPMPKILGWVPLDGEIAILTEKVVTKKWNLETRLEAAKIIARLHNIDINRLSGDLSALIRKSTVNRARVFNGLNLVSILDEKIPQWKWENPDLVRTIEELVESGEPFAATETLVHGDYFSSNILLDENGIKVIDWDLLSLGDPMWDLGFLIGADPHLMEEEIEATVCAYQTLRPINEYNLIWHKKCWLAFWQIQDLLRNVSKLGTG
jgi:aminoglycoside phosphotransferase (APT) family kinase protein